MTTTPEPGTPAEHIREALTLLRYARAHLIWGGAPRAREKVARAITSAEGALRHASRSDIADRRETKP